MDKVVDWLKHHWFLIVALFTISAAYGQATVKIQTMEQAIKENVIVSSEIKDLRVQSVRTEEKLKAVTESQMRQERMIEMMLMNQQRMIKEVAPSQRNK